MVRHLPNILSVLRLLAAPLAAWLLLQDHNIAAFALFLAAGISDFFDGYIARHWRSTSVLGAWLDSAADKFLILLSLIALLYLGKVPLWLVALVLLRDMGIAAGAALAWSFSLPLTFAPGPAGKATTAMLLAYVSGWMLLLAFDLDAPRLMQAGAITVAALTILSGAAYGRGFLRALFLGGRTA